MAENRVAAALGFFDGMHLGHDAVLKSAHTEAAKRGITVAVFTFAGEPDLPKFAGRR
ncbi:MAG: riboflavin biosynthesis protein RibF, partial [Ruminiclostridium sp.]|nr:riboflavin biosynthesis protein RibF [Ruminiclostridium sp.]